MLFKALLHPYPIRAATKHLAKSFQLGSYPRRLAMGAVERPHYGYCVYHAASLAAKLGYPRISVIEFGVAGGNGLVNLEYHVGEVSRLFPVEIRLFGFDTGMGLPAPSSYKDLPYMWKQGDFRMDVPRLKARLARASLVLGNVEETLPGFQEQLDAAPLGAAMFDLDLHSSTAAALKILAGDPKTHLPRVYCYFDDIIGSEVELYNNYTGQRLAIREFNENHSDRKLNPAYHFLRERVSETWHHQIQIFHNYTHPKYNDFVSSQGAQLPLKSRL
jgi:hypothetical protein